MKLLHITLQRQPATLTAAIIAALAGMPSAEAARAPDEPQASALVDGPYICRPVPSEGLRPVVVWIESEVLVVGAMSQVESLPAWVAANGAAVWRTPLRAGAGVAHDGGRHTLKLAGRRLDCQRTHED
jgi:hypothetical protein